MKKRKQVSSDDFVYDLDDIDASKHSSGGYATVFLSKRAPNKFVYRLEVIRDNEWDIKRETSIQKFLYDQRISPCIPEIYVNTTYALDFLQANRPDIHKFLDDRLYDTKGQFLSSYDRVSLIIMEAGNAGTLMSFSRADRPAFLANFRNITFMLCWTYWAANSQFGFRHRDIKPGNIVVKKLAQKETFVFQIRGGSNYMIETQYVPMLIDYGFASLVGTRSRDRHKGGTLYTIPPEFLAYSLKSNLRSLTVFGNGLYDEDGFDIFSIAISLMATLFRSRFISTAREGFSDVEIPKVPHPKLYKQLLVFCFLQNAIGNGLVPPDDLIDKVYDSAIFNKDIENGLKVVDETSDITDAFREMFARGNDLERAEKNMMKRVDYMRLFAHMLAWDPGERTSRFTSIFNVLFYASYATSAPTQFTYRANNAPLFTRQRSSEKEAKLKRVLSQTENIYSRICEGCHVEYPKPLSVCVCCSKILCSLSCHD